MTEERETLPSIVICPDFEAVVRLRPEAYQYVIQYPHRDNTWFVQTHCSESVFKVPPQYIPDGVSVIGWDHIEGHLKSWLRECLEERLLPRLPQIKRRIP